MSYAIIRNEKYKRGNLKGIYRHNERKNTNYSNKNIDKERTYMNYCIKSCNHSYEKEFDIIKEKYDLKGQIKTVSNIVCEHVITSDKEFFERIGENETKRYFEVAYKFVCEYKNLTEKYILSANVHIDEETPHMHLVFIPVVHTKNRSGNEVDKIACSMFWKEKDSYRMLQDAFYNYMKENGFDLERGKAVEITQRENLSVKEYKEITNFENTKKILENINLDLPKAPELKDIKKVVFKRDEIIEEKIIKPKDELIDKLYKDNTKLKTELSRQVNLVSKAETYQKENTEIKNDYKDLKTKYDNIKKKFDIKLSGLEQTIKEVKEDLNYFKKKYKELQSGVKTFVSWVASKLSNETENSKGNNREKR